MFEALKIMAEKNIGAVLVMQGDSLFGILTERDYERKVIILGKSSKDTTAKDIMSEKVMIITSSNALMSALP